MASQTALDRDRRATLTVQEWAREGYTGGQMLAALDLIAANPALLNYTPHLIAALRRSHLWQAIERAEVRHL